MHSALSQIYILDAYDKNLPDDCKDEIDEYQQNYEKPSGSYFWVDITDAEDQEQRPCLVKFLEDNGVESCQINIDW